MGQVNLGILSDIHGKVGTVVGANFRGINVIRARPKKSTKEPSKTQIEQRLRFSTTVKFVSPMKQIINKFYGSNKGVKSRLNLCMSYHAKEAITGIYPNLAIDYSKVIFTKGDLENATTASIENSGNPKVKFNWVNNAGAGFSKATDLAILMIYNPIANRFMWQMAAAQRDAETAEVTLPPEYIGDEVHAWLSFCSSDQKLAATSVYLGSLTLS